MVCVCVRVYVDVLPCLCTREARFDNTKGFVMFQWNALSAQREGYLLSCLPQCADLLESLPKLVPLGMCSFVPVSQCTRRQFLAFGTGFCDCITLFDNPMSGGISYVWRKHSPLKSARNQSGRGQRFFLVRRLLWHQSLYFPCRV